MANRDIGLTKNRRSNSKSEDGSSSYDITRGIELIC